MLELAPYGTQRQHDAVSMESFLTKHGSPNCCSLVSSGFRRLRRQFMEYAMEANIQIIEVYQLKNKAEAVFKIRDQSERSNQPFVILLDEPLHYIDKADTESEILKIAIDELRNKGTGWAISWFTLRDYDRIDHGYAMNQMRIQLGRGVLLTQPLMDYCSLQFNHCLEESVLGSNSTDFKQRLGLVRLSVCRAILASAGDVLHRGALFSQLLMGLAILADGLDPTQLQPGGHGWGGNAQGWETGWQSSRHLDAALSYLLVNRLLSTDHEQVLNCIIQPTSALSILIGTRSRGELSTAKVFAAFRNFERALRSCRNALEHPAGSAIGTSDMITSILISAERLSDTLNQKASLFTHLLFPQNWANWSVFSTWVEEITAIITRETKAQLVALVSRDNGLQTAKSMLPWFRNRPMSLIDVLAWSGSGRLSQLLTGVETTSSRPVVPSFISCPSDDLRVALTRLPDACRQISALSRVD